ncbi:16S rRNA (uracil(1498)-N(3))-methyltransferase [Pendulispora brunnea]|uniref:Ribosomal RNA small subunit methyltransferase E n=1 Tax=Pendulispora brunnea TaxID=2905690 RepID=A0ABZ2KBF6_9BACT
MAAPLRAPITDLREGTCTVREDTAHYLTRVLRLAVGATFVAFDPATAREADAAIASIEGGVTLHVSTLRPARVVAPRPLTFVQGLAKGDKCDAVVRDATELGATCVIVAECARSVVQLQGARRTSRLERWTRIAHEAARQCGRADPPRIELLPWAEAVSTIDEAARRFCLHVHEALPLGPLLLEAVQTEGAPIAFAAGPEGGLTAEEVALAVGRGWQCVSLGSLVLRTETAAAAVLGAVRVLES